MPMQVALRQFKAEIFHALSHPTRLAIIEILQEGETSGKELIERLTAGTINPLQHLSVLRAKKIILGRREGAQVFYRVNDPLIFELLAVGRRYFQAHMSEIREAIQHIETQTID